MEAGSWQILDAVFRVASSMAEHIVCMCRYILLGNIWKVPVMKSVKSLQTNSFASGVTEPPVPGLRLRGRSGSNEWTSKSRSSRSHLDGGIDPMDEVTSSLF